MHSIYYKVISFIHKKLCILILVGVGFCKDLGCDSKLVERTEKHFPLIAVLNKYWRRVEFGAIHIGHAGTTLHKTFEHLVTALSTVRPQV